ncbi:MAG: peptidoglycan-binding protein [Spirillospora sp.]
MTGSVVRRVRSVAWLLAVVLVAAAAWWAGTQTTSPRQKAAEASPPPASRLTAPVERRRLTRSVTARGVVRAGAETAITPEPAGGEGSGGESSGGGGSGGTRPVVTRLTLKTGQAVTSGTRLLEIGGRPLLAFPGKIPVYRDLTRDTRGDDVAQLQRALRSLGYSPGGDATGKFGTGTASAVSRFYKARGYAPPTRLVGGEGQESPGGTEPPKSERQVYVPASEIVFVRSLPARVTEVKVKVGDRVSGEALRLATGSPYVRAELQAGDSDVRATAHAQILAGGRSIDGTVTSVQDTKGSGGGDQGGAEGNEQGGRVAFVKPEDGLPHDLVGDQVTVRIFTLDTGGKVLAVPQAAIWTRADGTTHLAVEAPGGRSREVEVTTGRTADGYTELREADGIREGDQVLLGQGQRS